MFLLLQIPPHLEFREHEPDIVVLVDPRVMLFRYPHSTH